MLATSITCKNDVRAAVMAAGAVPSLMELMRNGSDMGRVDAAEVLDILEVE